MIYRIYSDKRHEVVTDGDMGVGERYVEADAEGWIPHDGKTCPLPLEARYDAKLRGGWVVLNQDVGYDGGWHLVAAYRPILDAKPEAPEWGGGLPPVGVECEAYIPSRDVWAKVKIVAHVEDLALFRNGTDGHFCGYKADRFRPIRSEEERRTDEAMKIIDATPDDFANVRGVVQRMIAAGYRKQ